MEDMPAKYTKSYPVKKIDIEGKVSKLDISLARESALEIILDGRHFTTLLTSPAEFKELAAGHLLTEGTLSLEEVSEIRLTEKKGENGKRIEVETAGNPEGRRKRKEDKKEDKKESRTEEKSPYVDSTAGFEAKAVFAGMAYLESGPYRLSRGTHLAALVDREGKMVARAIDVGRHNAVDKVVGKALFEGLPLPELYLLSTGRQPEYMVLKAARAGIPLIATKAMPLDSGVEAAGKANIGLVGKLSKESMLVFANEWRVKL